MAADDPPKVLLVIVEGLDSFSFTNSLPTNMELLKQAGAGSLNARTASNLTPSANLLQLLTSKTAVRCAGDCVYPAAVPPCSLIKHAKQNDLSVAVFHNSTFLNQLLGQDVWDDFCYLNGSLEAYDFKLLHLAAESIRRDRPDLCLLYLGWHETADNMSRSSVRAERARKLKSADRGLGIVLNMMSLCALFGTYHIHLLGLPVQSAGGCSGSGDAEVKVPWILLGPQIKPWYLISRRVSLLDTVPTLAKLLDLPPLYSWEGSPVEEIFLDRPTELNRVDQNDIEFFCSLARCVVDHSDCICQNGLLSG